MAGLLHGPAQHKQRLQWSSRFIHDPGRISPTRRRSDSACIPGMIVCVPGRLIIGSAAATVPHESSMTRRHAALFCSMQQCDAIVHGSKYVVINLWIIFQLGRAGMDEKLRIEK